VERGQSTERGIDACEGVFREVEQAERAQRAERGGRFAEAIVYE
jgi:hypothetical protein